MDRELTNDQHTPRFILFLGPKKKPLIEYIQKAYGCATDSYNQVISSPYI